MKELLFILLFLMFSLSQNAQAFLHSPIEGSQGNEWIIVNYVDWIVPGFQDYNCGSKSYDGHQGTDYTLPSFKAMDDSIAVYAAADGVITFIKDGLFDRETAGDVSKGLGNYIAIRHPSDYYTYYGHLMKNSILVNEGDSVNAGQTIAYVGSSGNSTDPHLHFELWYDSTFVVDPLAGSCGNPQTLFLDPPDYDTSLTAWESGIHLKNDLGINDLRERITTITKPYVIEPSSNEQLNYWSHMYGLKEGKEVKIKWFTPNNVEWFEYSVVLDQDYWYYYYWSYIFHDNLELGKWRVELYYDDEKIDAQTFDVRLSTKLKDVERFAACTSYEDLPLEYLVSDPNFRLSLITMNGTTIPYKAHAHLAPGLYYLRIQNSGNLCYSKRWIE